MDQKTLQQILKDTPVSGLRFFDATGSTNDIALEWIESAANDFSLVVADQQTAGRGRMQRKWVTNPGAALAFSLILHLTPEEISHAGLIPFIAGASVCSALENLFALKPQIKWPNDILIDHRKTTGILVESVWEDEDHASVVIGIGVNITPASLPPVENLALPAICVDDAVGHPVYRWQLLAAILSSLHTWRLELSSGTLIDYVVQRLAYRDEQVRIINNFGPEIHGRVVGIDPSGSLLLGTDDSIVPIQIGDVHLRLLND
jgi:BirA family biotin operon repressor/biotin-[acetyl-CoA-carboxylase] ligase